MYFETRAAEQNVRFARWSLLTGCFNTAGWGLRSLCLHCGSGRAFFMPRGVCPDRKCPKTGGWGSPPPLNGQEASPQSAKSLITEEMLNRELTLPPALKTIPFTLKMEGNKDGERFCWEKLVLIQLIQWAKAFGNPHGWFSPSGRQRGPLSAQHGCSPPSSVEVSWRAPSSRPPSCETS